ncbi:hypothetical protein [Duganella sp. Leaf61]|uniref:hypothetical protein n=1 Tax=Duganella sp. Leaf61 TaxID=1736227 RepID=UPI0012E24BDD|nr:hypothetical protein [Duganella sp. Leaf61]
MAQPELRFWTDIMKITCPAATRPVQHYSWLTGVCIALRRKKMALATATAPFVAGLASISARCAPLALSTCRHCLEFSDSVHSSRDFAVDTGGLAAGRKRRILWSGLVKVLTSAAANKKHSGDVETP